jgi:hypothetical protein
MNVLSTQSSTFAALRRSPRSPRISAIFSIGLRRRLQPDHFVRVGLIAAATFSVRVVST